MFGGNEASRNKTSDDNKMNLTVQNVHVCFVRGCMCYVSTSAFFVCRQFLYFVAVRGHV